MLCKDDLTDEFLILETVTVVTVSNASYQSYLNAKFSWVIIQKYS